jgi:hypothetical protein
MPAKNSLTVYPSDGLSDLITSLAKENRISASKAALQLIGYAAEHGYDVKRFSAELEVDRLRKDLLRLQEALRKAEEVLKNIPSPVADETAGQISDQPSKVFEVAGHPHFREKFSSPVTSAPEVVDKRKVQSEKDRFLNAVPYVVKGGPEITPEFRTTVLTQAREHPEWVEELQSKQLKIEFLRLLSRSGSR